jgi:hypothetical protein
MPPADDDAAVVGGFRFINDGVSEVKSPGLPRPKV